MKLYKNRKPSIGTVSHGTLREQDLIPAFLNELAYYAPKTGMRIANSYELQECDFDSDEFTEFCEGNTDACELIEALIDALNDIAPPLTYFGTTKGDGSDFGFWPVDISELIREGEILQFADDTRNPTHAELSGYNYFARVNDHGNVTVYARNYREVLAIV